MRSLTINEIEKNFPHSRMRNVQRQAFEEIISEGVQILELPTGSGKTAVGLALLQSLAKQGKAPLFYVTPSKVQVEQIVRTYPDNVSEMYGRNEYQCLYYKYKGQENITAEDSPCYMLDCPYRVDQKTGRTDHDNAQACPYFHNKFIAKQMIDEGRIIVCTTAFFIMNRLMVSGWKDQEPALVVIDEAHRLASTARHLFEHQITDYHLMKLINIVRIIDPEQAKILKKFRSRFIQIALRRESKRQALLKPEEIGGLFDILSVLDAQKLEMKVRQAMKAGWLDPVEHKLELKLLDNLIQRIPRLIKSLHYALGENGRNPLNFVIAFYYKKEDPEAEGKKARYHLIIRSYFVAPLINKSFGENVLAYSATIGDPKIFGFETGLRYSSSSFPSTFSFNKTRVYMPTDTPNLSVRKRRKRDPSKALNQIVAAAKRFAQEGHRSLVVVVSEDERKKFLFRAKRDGLDIVSYGNGVKPKQAAEFFVKGQGDTLVGTAANYAEGIDLPKQIAPVIFFFRPGYQRPNDPETQFEERRFSNGQCWALWNWRVMIQALQVRGRNIRSFKDVGVCFFISQQFRRFLYPALPDWLKPAYSGDKTMDNAIREAMELLEV